MEKFEKIVAETRDTFAAPDGVMDTIACRWLFNVLSEKTKSEVDYFDAGYDCSAHVYQKHRKAPSFRWGDIRRKILI